MNILILVSPRYPPPFILLTYSILLDNMNQTAAQEWVLAAE